LPALSRQARVLNYWRRKKLRELGDWHRLISGAASAVVRSSPTPTLKTPSYSAEMPKRSEPRPKAEQAPKQTSSLCAVPVELRPRKLLTKTLYIEESLRVLHRARVIRSE
jgi:hypothetical protein